MSNNFEENNTAINNVDNTNDITGESKVISEKINNIENSVAEKAENTDDTERPVSEEKDENTESGSNESTVNADDKKTMRKKKRKKIFKILLRIIGIGFAAVIVLLLLLFVFTHKIIFDFFDMSDKNSLMYDYTPQYSEIHLTNEQMLSDFEYYYDLTVTNSFVTEQAERYLGFDYSKLHDEYAERIRNCKDEFEFFSLLTSFNAKSPGAHNCIYGPTENILDNNTFPLSYEFGNEEVMDANYSYWKQFEDRIFSYDQKKLYLSYYGGDYVTVYGSESDEYIPGLKNAKLLTLDGKAPEEAILDIDTLHKYRYDANNDRVYADELIFNDGTGEKHTGEFMLPDGSIVTVDLYNSCEFNAAMYFQRVYPDHGKTPEELEALEESEENTEEGNNENTEAVRCYKIQKFPERKLVIVSLYGCVETDSPYAYIDIADALKETDAETVIVDNRNNKGGNFLFVLEGVCPALFQKNYKSTDYIMAPRNELTDLLYGNAFYSRTMETGVKIKPDKVSYYEKFDFEGHALKEYDIYLINGADTFSSGDILSGIFADHPNVTIIGNNTSGEGFSGHPMAYYLPESKICYAVSVSVSETFPDNNYLGTLPDIQIDNDWECYYTRQELMDLNGRTDDLTSLEGRLQWDKTMIEVINIIDSKNGQ